MWNEPTATHLAQLPKLYDTESTPPVDKIIYLHFFIFGSDWFITEFDGDDIFYGYAILNGDLQNAEWGYISFNELKQINIDGVEIDCEINWKPRSFSKVIKNKGIDIHHR